jgi:Uma2 family endonuclease
MSTITAESPIRLQTAYRLTLEQYERIVDAGILGKQDRVHLINGILVAKMTENDRHATADDLCGLELNRVIPPGWYVRAAKPIRLPAQTSKPEPDRCLVRGHIRDYTRRTPEPQDIALVVEVADTSLNLDRLQAGMYAASGIPVYWIVNLRDGQIEIRGQPGADGYQTLEIFTPGQTFTVTIDGIDVGQIAVSDILP